MLKKGLLAIILSVLTPIVHATSDPYPYVGASLGITSNTATKEIFGSYRGAPVGIFAGFGGVIYQSFFLAAELSATLFTTEISNQGAVKTNYGGGISILPGIELCDQTILFGRLGVVRTHFSNVRLPAITTTRNMTGGQFGAGIQTGIGQNLDLRGEYDFIDYGTLSAGGYSAKPRSDIATVSLIYKFA